jgi:hypothetical protein
MLPVKLLQNDGFIRGARVVAEEHRCCDKWVLTVAPFAVEMVAAHFDRWLRPIFMPVLYQKLDAGFRV